MKFNVTIEGKHVLFLIVLVGIAVGVNYAGAVWPDVGHDAYDIGPGIMTGPIEVSGGLSVDNLGVSGGLSTATLTVSGITTFKGVAYTWPSSMGLSSQVLSIQDAGTGQLAWINSVDSDWVIAVNDMYSGVSGKVGIGTTSPQYKLDVRGGRIQLTEDGTGDWIALRTDGYAVDLSSSGADLYITPQNDGENILLAPSTDSNVGIGTIAPDKKLHIEGSLIVDAYYNGGEGSGIFFREDFYSTAQPSITLKDHSGSSPDGLSINAYDGISFTLNAAEKVRITSTGSVGIGTDDPGFFKLRVAGGPLQVDTSGESQFKSGNTYIHLKAIEGAGSSGYGEIGAYRSGEGWKNLILNAGGGYVGIGMTTPPQYQLDVNGWINANDGLCVGGVCSSSWPPIGTGPCSWSSWSTCTAAGGFQRICPSGEVMRGYQRRGCSADGCADSTRCEQVSIYCCS